MPNLPDRFSFLPSNVMGVKVPVDMDEPGTKFRVGCDGGNIGRLWWLNSVQSPSTSPSPLLPDGSSAGFIAPVDVAAIWGATNLLPRRRQWMNKMADMRSELRRILIS